MQDLSIDIKTLPQAFRGYYLLLVITCNQTNFMIAVPLRDPTAQMVAEALIYRVIYLFGPPRQIICDEAILAKYLEAVEDDLEETAPEFEPVFTNVYQYYGNSLISFTNTIDDLLLQLPILIKLKVQVPMSLSASKWHQFH